MTNLQSVKTGMNKFCGPAVLSILTGRDTDECAYAIGRINGSYQVKGVLLPDLLKAADSLGFLSKKVETGNTLFSTMIRLAHNDGMYIVMVPNHFVVIEVVDKKIYFCDNHTKEPIQGAASARLGQQVISAYQVYKKPELEPAPIPIKLDSYITVNRTIINESEHTLVEVVRHTLFDIEEANQSNTVVSFIVESQAEYNQLVDLLKRGVTE
jgi:hypothetical protein